MYIIETYLDKSTIHGIGVFSKEKILKDTLIWELSSYDHLFYMTKDKRMSNASFPKTKSIYPFLKNFGYLDQHKRFICPADNNAYVNHSFTPNTYEAEEGNKIYALRDIEKGEEITEDYTKFMDNDFFENLKIK